MTCLVQGDVVSSKERSPIRDVARSVLALAVGLKLAGLVLLPKIDAVGTHRCGPYAYAKAAATLGWTCVVLNAPEASSLISRSSKKW